MKFDREYYERQYRDYEAQNPDRKLQFYRRLAEAGARGPSCPSILDIGCAFGLFLSQLGDGWRRYGEDASEYAIARARERVPGAQFAVSNPPEHPYEGPFDAITAFDVLEHVAQLEELLDWIFRNLSPGGVFVFAVPVYDGPTGPIIRFLDRDPTHIHRRSRGHWLRLTGKLFRLVDWWGIYRYLLPGGVYLHATTRRLRWFTPAIACLMRRP